MCTFYVSKTIYKRISCELGVGNNVGVENVPVAYELWSHRLCNKNYIAHSSTIMINHLADRLKSSSPCVGMQTERLKLSLFNLSVQWCVGLQSERLKPSTFNLSVQW